MRGCLNVSTAEEKQHRLAYVQLFLLRTYRILDTLLQGRCACSAGTPPRPIGRPALICPPNWLDGSIDESMMAPLLSLADLTAADAMIS